MRSLWCFFAVFFVMVSSAGAGAADANELFGEPTLRTTSGGTAYRFYGDVRYLQERPECLDLYLPADEPAQKRPVVLIIHGGGWTGGKKDDPRQVQFAEFMVEQGYAAASISYQLTIYEGQPWKSKRIKGGWPQNIYDCKSALRFLRRYGDMFYLDGDRVVVMGGSAGGHLALLTGLSADCAELNAGGLYTEQRNDVCGILNFYGIPDVRVWGGSNFIDVSRTAHPEVWALASPVEHLSEKSPPILILHGDKDATVDIKLSEAFVEALEQKGLTYEYVVVEGGPHSFALQWEEVDLRPVVKAFVEACFEQSGQSDKN